MSDEYTWRSPALSGVGRGTNGSYLLPGATNDALSTKQTHNNLRGLRHNIVTPLILYIL